MSIFYSRYYGSGYNRCFDYSYSGCYGKNTLPEADDDCFTTNEDSPLTLSFSSLLSNDRDRNNDKLTITSVQNASHGSVAIVNGKVVFTPTKDYFGPASFSYTVSDGKGGTSTATVSVNVCPVNDVPNAQDDTIKVTQSGPVTLLASTLLANDNDVDGDKITIKSVQSASNGSVALVNGNVVFTPTPGFSGLASFTYTISDGKGGFDTATVTLNIAQTNVKPDAINDTFIGEEDKALVLTPAQLLANDLNIDSSIKLVSVQNAVNGSVTLINGNVVFTPVANFAGPASFTYTISSGTAINKTLNFEGMSAGQSVKLPSGWCTDNPNGVVEINAASVYGISGSANKVIELERNTCDASNLYTVIDSNKNTPVTISFDYSARAGYTKGNDSAILLIVDGKTIATINTQTVGFTHLDYTVNGTGQAMRIEFRAAESSNSTGGLLDNISITQPPFSDTATVFLNFANTNDNPDALDDTLSNVVTTSININPSQLLLNDKDIDNDTLVLQSVQSATHGQVSIVSGQIQFIPEAGYQGPASFTYTISDGKGGTDTATVFLVVSTPNQTPVAQNDSFAANEDAPLTLGLSDVLNNDQDPDNDTLTVVSVQSGLHGSVSLNNGSIVFVPEPNYFGPASFTYTVSDGKGGLSTATVNLSIANVDDAATITNTSVSVSEEGLLGGLADSTGIVDTGNSTLASGNMNLQDIDGNSHLSLTLLAPTQPLFSLGQPVVWQGSETQLLTAMVGQTEVATVSINNQGEYQVKLLQAFQHSGLGEDLLSFDVGVRLSQDNQADSLYSLTVNIEDDSPIAISTARDVALIDSNLMIALDVSGSMNQQSGIDNYTRLESAVRSINNLLDIYDSYGDIKVRLVTFSSDANTVGDHWFTIDEAKLALSNLVANGATNYDAPLGHLMDAYSSPGMLANAQTVSYFFSDGNPNRGLGDTTSFTGDLTIGDDDGIQSSEEAAWVSFLEQHQIKSFAIGIGKEITNVDALAPIAYDGQAQTDLNGVIVSEFSELDKVLAGTTMGTYGKLISGTTLSNNAGAGADGGYIKSITVDGETLSFDPLHHAITGSGTLQYQFDAISDVLSITLNSSAKLVIDMVDGSYQYVPPTAINNAFVEQIRYIVSDNDGDVVTDSLSIAVDKTNIVVGTTGNDQLIGSTQPNLLIGQEGNDLLRGGIAKDTLLAGDGNDIIIGGGSSDTLSGGLGADTFVWSLSDTQTASTEVDTILDFGADDRLNLQDLLQGESLNAESLDNYLHFNFAEGNTTILISASGQFGDHTATGTPTVETLTHTDQQIVLSGVNLMAGLSSNTDVIQQLLNQNKLITD